MLEWYRSWIMMVCSACREPRHLLTAFGADQKTDPMLGIPAHPTIKRAQKKVQELYGFETDASPWWLYLYFISLYPEGALFWILLHWSRNYLGWYQTLWTACLQPSRHYSAAIITVNDMRGLCCFSFCVYHYAKYGGYEEIKLGGPSLVPRPFPPPVFDRIL